MTWTIRDIVLPIDPREIRKRTLRIQQPVPVSGDFPEPSINQPTRFELVITGLIWPRQLAQQLDEATKNAETENIKVSVSDEVAGQEWLSGEYSVSRSEVSRTKPMYTKDNGIDVEVYEYNLTLAKFADAGGSQDSEQGGPSEDEPTSFLDMPEVAGWDENGDGDVDFNELFNWFNSLLTFGFAK